MTTLQKSALGLALTLLIGFGLYEASIVRQERRDLAQLTAQLAAVRAPPPPASAGRALLPPAAAAVSPTPAAPVDSTVTASPFEQRVALLKQLLNELPAQQLPELKLLTSDDWLAVARTHELDSAADIRVALADLRAVARKKFAASLQEALRSYTTAFDGRLPADILQLAPRLTAPADAEMLARYEFIRTGKVGDASEKLIREKKTSDMILSVVLDGWSLNNNSDLPRGFGETENDALDRAWRALGTALGNDAKAGMEAMDSPATVATLMQDSMKQVVQLYGSDDAMGDALKQAVKNFRDANPQGNLTDVAQVLPYLAQADKFVETLRPTLAQLAYFTEHMGKLPPDAAALQTYLNRPFNPAEALQVLKLSTDGEHVNLNFNWEFKK